MQLPGPEAYRAGQGAIISSYPATQPQPGSTSRRDEAGTVVTLHDTTLREVMRGVAASVVLVTTGSPAGDRHAMTASSFTSVSLEPATVLVCIHTQAGICSPVSARRRFAINVLGAGQEAIARLCSGSRVADRFAGSDWCYDAAGLPYLASAQAVLFCETEHNLEAGTHRVLLGRVTRALGSGAADPLLYLNGGFLESASARSEAA